MILIPGYEGASLLREGRRSVILRGRRVSDGRPVIIKALRREHPSLRDVARLRHEYAVLSRFDDDDIVRAIEFVERGSRVALVLEDFGGESLREQIPPGGLPLEAFFAVAPRIVRALAIVHAAGVLHKDVKPDNIIADAGLRRVALADFSIASLLSEERSTAASPEMLEGSLAYLSPEQTGRMNRPVDYRSDYYSLGATFYELVTGSLPFYSSDPVELVHAHVARLPSAPATVRPAVPEVLSDLIMRLLAKNAEARYQSTAGLLADLERIRVGIAEHGPTFRCPLGQDDRSEQFHLPSELYGREADAAALLAAFERACAGSNELVLVAGPAGIGKSALIREIHRPMVRHRGYFIAGKFDQLGRDTPYSALAQALRELVLRILGEPEGRLVRWRETLGAALGASGQVVLEVVPDLERLIGPQPPVPALPPAESANRFQATLRALIRAFADERHPVAIFLDDLQWSDPATLKLIEALVGDPELRHILWIGAYRDDEVPPDHLLARVRRTLEVGGAALTQLKPAPLGPAEVTRLIADALRCTPAEAAELAAVVRDRSEGNPFFVRTYLQSLHEQGAIAFDRDRGAWAWTRAGVEQAALPDDVVGLVARRIAGLSPTIQALLRTAACVGNRFDLRLVARCAGEAVPAALGAVFEAVQAGLLRPIGDDYKYAIDEPRAVEFEFTHDRVQQTAYGLIPVGERPRLHLALGRMMLQGGGDAAPFAVAGHLNQAAALLDGDAERLQVAELDLQAARRAKAATAYGSACNYLAAGMGLLPREPWQYYYGLAFGLHRERVECEYLAGNPEQALEVFGPLLTRARTVFEKADLFALRAVLETNRGDLRAAIAAGREGLALFGVTLPERGSTLALLKEFARYRWLRRGLSADAVRALPECRDEVRRAELRVMVAMTAAAYFTDTNLALLLLLRVAGQSLKYGVTEVSAYGFSGVGLVLAAALGRYEAADEHGRLAIDLNERFGNAELRARVALFRATFMMSFIRPLPEVQAALRDATAAGLEAGDIIYAVYSAVTEVFLMVIAGDPLAALRERAEAILLLVKRRGLADQIATLSYMIELFGGALREADASGPDDVGFRATIDDERTPLVMFYFHLYRAMHMYLRADYAAAREALGEAVTRTKVAFGSAIAADLRFWEGLILARAEPEGRESRAAIDRALKQLATWARGAPATFAAREALVRGERARVRGDDGEALRCYNQAIALAREQRAPNVEGLACECALRFARDRGWPVLARAYLIEAIGAYRSWGADAQVARLAREFSAHLPDQGLPTRTAGHHTTTTMTRSTSTIALDLDTVVKIGQAISGELQMDLLLKKLVSLLVESAGARRGVLVLSEGGVLRVEAESTFDHQEASVGIGVAVDDYERLPRTIVHLVARVREDVVLADAITDPVHGADPYVVAFRPRSLLCTPILYQGELSCILYLENELTAAVFTHRRLALIKQIAAQVAISLTNARLYRSLQEARNAALTADRAKTRFLMNMSHELRTPLNAILGYTELISENVAAGELDTIDRDLQAIHRAGLRLLRSVSSILELTRLEADAREARLERIDVFPLLRELAGQFAGAAADGGNMLHVTCPEGLPPLVADRSMVRYCLTTLIDNACRFTQGGRIEVRASRFERDGRPWYEFVVADSGVGIAAEALPKIFGAFAQADDSTTRRFEGTGVSLAVAQRFCALLGGEIRVDSEVGAGTVFTMQLPLDAGERWARGLTTGPRRPA